MNKSDSMLLFDLHLTKILNILILPFVRSCVLDEKARAAAVLGVRGPDDVHWDAGVRGGARHG